MTIAINPYLKATLPQTTKVPAENMVMNPLNPDAHQGDCLPAANMSLWLAVRIDAAVLMANTPSR